MPKLQIIKTSRAMQKLADSYRRKNKTIGLVPTMGALHEGHVSLIRKSVSQNDITVVSIFVNPTQFGPNEDFSKYPRAFKADCELAKKAGANAIFHPEVKEMYPDNFQTFVVPGKIADKLEGAARPGHMQGVATVCTKLFNIIKPHRAYFGQKDAQQLAVIKSVVRDLNLNLQIVGCPIVRTKGDVAMSSRHSYLSPEQLKYAEVIHDSLKLAKMLIQKGERNIKSIRMQMAGMIESVPETTVEYIAFNRWDDLDELTEIKGKVLISLIVRIAGVRLLDNVIVKI